MVADLKKIENAQTPFTPEPTPLWVIDEILHRLSRKRIRTRKCKSSGLAEGVSVCACVGDAAPDPERKCVRASRRLSESERVDIAREVKAQSHQRSYIDTIRDYVRDYCDSNPAVLYRRSGVSRNTYSQMISHPEREVSKETIVALAFGMQLDYDEAKEFLHEAGWSFSSRCDDRVYKVCFKKGCWNILDINYFLRRSGSKKLLPVNFE